LSSFKKTNAKKFRWGAHCGLPSPYGFKGKGMVRSSWQIKIYDTALHGKV